MKPIILSKRDMMKQDRFLIGILTAVGLLVIAALALFFIRQDTDEYGVEDTPEGLVRNYVIAIHNGDFEKAYSYLQNSATKPDYQEFWKTLLDSRFDSSNISVKIVETNITNEKAHVKLSLTYGGTHPFQGSWSETSSALLVLQDGSWKLIEMPYPYWDWDWYP